MACGGWRKYFDHQIRRFVNKLLFDDGGSLASDFEEISYDDVIRVELDVNLRE